ncbi:bifunctional diguanylate cyclase/phosphodiesterase [Aurantimonas sp. HBX-1]|uniref:putative bifunctional diguanylate cyclase/phosphodiesterase n=1 Tax=Aurantimonas sp. HBX-1 TaxID=2906072 RepID=UPI001F28E61A|nr:EAL domain-containing protein [Aurantimonas sp. HBX-1]UIJ70525.1 EAL domain-containing protein [Aurantimonas sp. HBX-1]
MPIKLKLLLGCLCLTLLTLGLGAYALKSQRDVGTLAERIYDEALVSMSYLRSAQNRLLKQEAAYRAFAMGESVPDGTALSPLVQAQPLAAILQDLQVASERAISAAGKKQTSDIHRRLIALATAPATTLPSQVLAELRAIDAELDVAVEIFAGDGFRFRREVRDRIERSLDNAGFAMAGAIAIALAISLMLTRAIVPPLNQAVTVARAIAAGRLDNEIRPQGVSETARLLTALATMQESISEKMQRIRDLMAAQADSYNDRMQQQHARFDAALNNMSQGLCMFDDQQRLVVFNRRFAQMFGGIQLGVEAKDVLIDPELSHVLASQTQASYNQELPDGRMIAISHQPIERGGWVATFEDVTDRHHAQLKLSHMATHDALTGLPNRVRFRERLESVVRKPRGARRVAVLSLDLDGFKTVNDTLGHPTGDKLLKAAAERLRLCVGKDDLLARFGGDEFVIVQIATHPEVAAATLARQIIEVLSRPFVIDGHEMVVGVSIGIVLPGFRSEAGPERNVDVLIKNADIALYRAKAEGRSTWRFFERAMDTERQARRTMEIDLRVALERGELELFYQPFVDVARQRISGFEALMRWRHPVRGFVSPAEFIPVAEDCGLIHAMGAWALETACAQAAGWPEDLVVSVNLSPVQFKKPGLADDVERALAASGLAPQRLQLEVTESLLLQDTESVIATLNGFRDRGIGISMDDFGTGYSSLGYLNRFPFDKIKIDQSFVRTIEAKESRAIIRAVIGLSRALGMAVLAEGVETREQRDALILEGCSEMQGFHFSKPRPANELPQVLIEFGLRHRMVGSAVANPAGRLAVAAV